MTIVTLVGCTAAPRPAPASTFQIGPPLDYRRAQARMHLDRWDAVAARATGRAFVPVEDTLRVVGQWEPALAVAGPQMIASGNSWSAPQEALPDPDPRLAHVRWADGTGLDVAVVPIGDTALQLENEYTWAGARCSSACMLVRLGSARLVTDTIDTTSGPATAPFWSWPVRGSRVRIEKLAVRLPVGVVVTAVPTYNVKEVFGAWVSPDGRTLTLHFIGGGGHADQVCGHDYVAEVVESDHAVVPIVIETVHRNPIPCAGGYFRTAIVGLSRPLGDRTVLQEETGEPMPTNLT